MRTIVGLIGSVANALDLGAAARAWPAIAAVHSHVFAKCRNFLGKFCTCFSPEILRPLDKRLFRGLKEPLDFFGLHTLRQKHRRELRVAFFSLACIEEALDEALDPPSQP